MDFDYISTGIAEFAKNDPQGFWITVGVIVIFLFFIFKKKGNGSSSSVGMNKYNFELFKRRR